MSQATLTPDEMKVAASRLCELRGINPDEMQQVPWASNSASVQKTKAWVIAQREIRAHLEIRQAINFAKGV